MKISNFKRITKEDFPQDQHSLIDKLAFSINAFAEETINILNGKINKDNLVDKVKSFDTKLKDSGEPVNEVRFRSPIYPNRIEGLRVIKVENLTSSGTYPTTAPFITYSETGDSIIIKHITGLQSGSNFRIKIEIIGV